MLKWFLPPADVSAAAARLCVACSEEELPELETLVRSGAAPFKAQGGVESKQGKANVLIQVRAAHSHQLHYDILSRGPSSILQMAHHVGKVRFSCVSHLENALL